MKYLFILLALIYLIVAISSIIEYRDNLNIWSILTVLTSIIIAVLFGSGAIRYFMGDETGEAYIVIAGTLCILVNLFETRYKSKEKARSYLKNIVIIVIVALVLVLLIF